MRLLATACLFFLFVPTGYAAPTLAEARSRWLHGNYEEALTLYQALARDPADSIVASIGVSRCYESRGEYEKAIETVATALRAASHSADLWGRQAELHYLLGQWEPAEQAIAKALAGKPDHFVARWVRSQIYRDRGDWQKADVELRWFVRIYSERMGRKDEIRDPEELLLVGLAAAENARWHKMGDQFRLVLNDVFAEALKSDKDYWPAEYQAGMLLLEKYNQRQAPEAFDKALAINPRAADAIVGKGMLALQKYELADAELFASQASRINPRLPQALRLLADIHLFSGDIAEAKRALSTALAVNSRDELTRGRWAACLHLGRDPSGFASFIRETLKYNPRPAVFYYVMATQLEERKRYQPAEEYYKKAMEAQPWLPWPQNGLGLLYMRLGREEQAKQILAKALEADEFNVRVFNSLRVLRHLEHYETLRSEHFDIRFDPQNDRRLVRYMAPYLEEIHQHLKGKFQYAPPGRTLIEVFNDHEMFSGRVIALPDLHTIGASTGRIIAMASPNARGVSRPFNWARVLRHELVHVFNLEQTNFQAPHWLTEGLAVIEEGFSRQQQWNALLSVRVPAGEVLNLDNIELAFIRPRSQLDWQMAYCQSQLYIEYLVKHHGGQAIGECLQAYRDGLDTAATINKVCHVSKEVFEKGYQSYLQEASRSLHAEPSPLGYRQLRKTYQANPQDPDLAARMAEQHLIRGERTEARKLAEAALAKNGAQALAAYVKATLLRDAGSDDEARALLERAVEGSKLERKVLQALAKLYYESREFDKAAALYERAHRLEPQATKWLTGLLRVYTQAGDKKKRLGVLKKLVETDADNFDMRKELARLLSEAGQYGEAERYARQALEIDVRDNGVKDILLRALAAQHKDPEASRVRALLDG